MATRKQKAVLVRMARNIKTARVGRKITQEEAAFRSGIGYKRWQQLEAGRANTTILTLIRIASVLKVDIHRLLSA